MGSFLQTRFVWSQLVDHYHLPSHLDLSVTEPKASILRQNLLRNQWRQDERQGRLYWSATKTASNSVFLTEYTEKKKITICGPGKMTISHLQQPLQGPELSLFEKPYGLLRYGNKMLFFYSMTETRNDVLERKWLQQSSSAISSSLLTVPVFYTPD